MALANIIAQLESQKYSSLAGGIAGAATAYAEGGLRKKRESLLDIQLDTARKEQARQTDIDAIMKDDSYAQPMDRVQALRDKGYHNEALQYHKNEMSARKMQAEEQINNLNLGVSKGAFLGKYANSILSAPEENRGAILATAAEEFTAAMTVDPNNPITIEHMIPPGMTDPTAIATHFQTMAQDVNQFIRRKSDQVVTQSKDAIMQLAYEKREAEKKGDTDMANMYQDRIDSLEHTTKLAQSTKEIQKAKTELNMDFDIIDESENAVANHFDIDANAMLPGFNSMVRDLRDQLKNKPFNEAIDNVMNQYEIKEMPIPEADRDWLDNIRPSWLGEPTRQEFVKREEFTTPSPAQTVGDPEDEARRLQALLRGAGVGE